MNPYVHLRRAYALKKLTQVFETFVGIALTEPLEAGQRSHNTQTISH